MGVGVFARLQHTPGIRLPTCAFNMGPEIRDWGPALPAIAIRQWEVSSGRVLINAQIAAPAFLGHNHRLSKKTQLSNVKIARHESGVRHPTTSLHARIWHRHSGGDDPCHQRDLSRDKTECRAPRVWRTPHLAGPSQSGGTF